MTTLGAIIREKITDEGPIGIDEYMSLCLSNPRFGYYMTRDPLGNAGDFTTAPEISQIFGELIGLWLAQAWLDQNQPETINLVELGPGRGTLMADILRVAQKLPAFANAIDTFLVETSPMLTEIQKKTLSSHEVIWLESTDNLPANPTFFVANEFFDALPAKQFQKVDDIWLERVVTIKDNALSFGLQKSLKQDFHPGLPDGTIVETSTHSVNITKIISHNINKLGGAALICDYGSKDGSGDTLQAIRNHKFASIFEEPGTADLTTHVNFGNLIQTVQSCACRLTTQQQFLTEMGIMQRAQTLAEGKDATTQASIKSAVARLTEKDQMGSLFKVLSILPSSAPEPPGFAKCL